MVVFPEPVGPVTSRMPSLAVSSDVTSWRSSSNNPSEVRSRIVSLVFRIRITTFSPVADGSDDTRRSTGCPLTETRARPSWGRRRSAISSPDMILSREIRGIPAERGTFIT